MKLFYLRDKKRQPVACVAWDYDGKTIRFALSTYNPIDPYKKEIGRALAIGRFSFAPHTIGTAVPIVGVPTILGIIVHDGHDFPARTRRAAELWLKNPPQPKTRKNKAA
jgi:hypothetical protein